MHLSYIARPGVLWLGIQVPEETAKTSVADCWGGIMYWDPMSFRNRNVKEVDGGWWVCRKEEWSAWQGYLLGVRPPRARTHARRQGDSPTTVSVRARGMPQAAPIPASRAAKILLFRPVRNFLSSSSSEH